jgi:hypothetical protein
VIDKAPVDVTAENITKLPLSTPKNLYVRNPYLVETPSDLIDIELTKKEIRNDADRLGMLLLRFFKRAVGSRITSDKKSIPDLTVYVGTSGVLVGYYKYIRLIREEYEDDVAECKQKYGEKWEEHVDWWKIEQAQYHQKKLDEALVGHQLEVEQKERNQGPG